jgi:predicted RNA-binding Zn-ribbon protein involved in translation (DUF1610 family)
MTAPLPLFAAAPPKEPYGYRCNDCGHLWDARTPMGRPADVIAALDHAKNGHCPECGVIGTASTVNPQRYAELKAEKKVREIAGGTA